MMRLALVPISLLAGAALAQERPPGPFEVEQRFVRAGGSQRFDADAHRQCQTRDAGWTEAHARLLDALRAAQGEDGRMPAAAQASDVADVAATALAVLAFASNGSTVRVGTTKDPIKKGIVWLKGKQKESGWFVDSSLPGAIPAQALAAMAMTQLYVDSNYVLLKNLSQRALAAIFACDAAAAPPAETFALALAVLADGIAPEHARADARRAQLAALLGDTGFATVDATRAKLVGPLPGTHELATFTIAMACHGTAIPADDPRWLALAPRIVSLRKRSGDKGELLDAATLFASGDAAIRLGGPAWAAWRELVTERIVPRVSAVDGKGSVTFACGIEVLRNENAESALTALALATPWYCVGTPRTRR
jgi:hypothetical protein